MKIRRWIWLLVAGMLLSACAAPATPAPTAVPTQAQETGAAAAPPPTAVVLAPLPSTIPLPTLAPLLAPAACLPQITANAIINVRNGPGTIYSIIGSMNEAETARVAGKNADGSWWYIVFPSGAEGHAWVAGSVTTPECMTSTLPVIAASSLPAPYMPAVTNVVVSVDPSEVNVPGCVGSTPRMTAYAIIDVSGPMQIQYTFEIEGVGTMKTETISFSEMGSRQISQTFKADGVQGSHTVRLWIEGLNMRGWQYQARYKVTC